MQEQLEVVYEYGESRPPAPLLSRLRAHAHFTANLEPGGPPGLGGEARRQSLLGSCAPGERAVQASSDRAADTGGAAVQSSLCDPTHASLVGCLLTSDLVDAPLFRLDIPPSPANIFKQPPHAKADKLLALPHDRIRERIGTVDDGRLPLMNRALALISGPESA